MTIYEDQEQEENEENKVTVVTADVHNISSGTASWDYLEEPTPGIKNKTEPESCIPIGRDTVILVYKYLVFTYFCGKWCSHQLILRSLISALKKSYIL